jgi:hypothetical protein
VLHRGIPGLRTGSLGTGAPVTDEDLEAGSRSVARSVQSRKGWVGPRPDNGVVGLAAVVILWSGA